MEHSLTVRLHTAEAQAVGMETTQQCGLRDKKP